MDNRQLLPVHIDNNPNTNNTGRTLVHIHIHLHQNPYRLAAMINGTSVLIDTQCNE